MLADERTENSCELRCVKSVVSPDIFSAGVQVPKYIEITDGPILDDGVILKENGVRGAKPRRASPLPCVIIIAKVLSDICAIVKRVVIDNAVYAVNENRAPVRLRKNSSYQFAIVSAPMCRHKGRSRKSNTDRRSARSKN